MTPALVLSAVLAAGAVFPPVVTIRRERVPGLTELSTGAAISDRHVVTLGAFTGPGSSPFVELDGDLHEPDTIHVCPDMGIAVLAFDSPVFYDFSKPDSRVPEVGETLVLVGQGLSGIISISARVVRHYEDGALLLSAPRMEGLMGAVAFDGEGSLVGLVTGVVSFSAHEASDISIDYLAVLPSQMWYIWADLAMEGSPRNEVPFGITATSCSGATGRDRPAGVLIVAVASGSMADGCGLRPGDVITRVDTVRTYHPESVRGLLMQTRDSLEAEVWFRGCSRVISLPPLR